MHPFCRSTTLPVLPDEEELDRQIKEIGDEIGADVSFDEWQKNLVETEDGKLIYRVDKAGKSGIIKESDKFVIPQNKINEFYLKPGAKHSNDFFDVGYTVNDYGKLFDDIEKEFDITKAVDEHINDDGTTDFSVFMKLGITKKKNFRTVWRIDSPNSKPRNITAHREDKDV